MEFHERIIKYGFYANDTPFTYVMTEDELTAWDNLANRAHHAPELIQSVFDAYHELEPHNIPIRHHGYEDSGELWLLMPDHTLYKGTYEITVTVNVAYVSQHRRQA